MYGRSPDIGSSRFADDVAPELSGLVGCETVGPWRVREYRLWTGYTFPAHAHSSVGFVVGTKGRFTAEIDGMPLHVEPGRGMVLPHGEVHCETVGALGARCLLVEPDRHRGALRAFTRPRVVRTQRARALPAGTSRFMGRRHGQVQQALAELIEAIGAAYRDACRPLPRWVREAWLRAHSNPEAWTVAALARSVCVAPETLCRGFTRFFGTTPSETLQAARLERAAHRLSEGHDSISSVAFESGFSDQSHLTNRFVRRFGITPGALRRAGTGSRRIRSVQDTP